MPMFSCHLALTFSLKNLRISDITTPTTEFGLRLLRKSRVHVNKNLRFDLGSMTSYGIAQYEDGMNRSVS